MTSTDADTASSFSMEGLAHLEAWGLILARGADAASFLHGQLTQDITGLAPGQARLAGYCSPKGRLLASFIAWRADTDAVALACSADLLAPTLKRLSMFVLRAKCKLADATADWPLWGAWGASSGQALGAAATAPVWAQGSHAGLQWVRLPDADGTPRWLVAGPQAPEKLGLQPAPAARWAELEVRSGMARVTAATSDHFVPQMLNFELLGGVNFKKGCYPGQEVVARSQYRGTLKRRTFLMRAPGALGPGAEVFHATDPGQPAGEVVNAAQTADGGWVALVEAKLSAAAAGQGFNLAGMELSAGELPYEVPAENA